MPSLRPDLYWTPKIPYVRDVLARVDDVREILPHQKSVYWVELAYALAKWLQTRDAQWPPGRVRLQTYVYDSLQSPNA